MFFMTQSCVPQSSCIKLTLLMIFFCIQLGKRQMRGENTVFRGESVLAKLHFYYAAMNAGKSTALLQSAHNYIERGLDCLLFSPKIDNRYGTGKITSRIGLDAEAYSLDMKTNLYREVLRLGQTRKRLACVMIDEAHFLSRMQIIQAAEVVDKLDLPVLAYGLRSDFRGEPFEGSMYLMAVADSLVELKTICHCGRKATMNMRIDQRGQKVTSGAQIQIGGNDMYVATCRKHFGLGETGTSQTHEEERNQWNRENTSNKQKQPNQMILNP